MTLSGVGVVDPLKFSKIPLSDHGVHLKGVDQLAKLASHIKTHGKHT